MVINMQNTEGEVIINFKWMRADIRQLLKDNDRDCSEEVVDRFLAGLDKRRFEEACIEDGWERLLRLMP